MQQFSANSSLLGQQITAFVPGEGEVVGIVDAVTAGESGAILRVNGRNIQLDNVLRVDRATPTPSDDATAPAPATGADQ